MSRLLGAPNPTGTTQNEPDPEGIQQAFARSGYRLEEALADLVDNSLDAAARNVLIRFVQSHRAIERVVIADDGHGIEPGRIDSCMQFGARIRHRPEDRGKYGIGLKSASFSQARSLTVVSRKSDRVVGRRWTVESIRQGWLLEILDTKASEQLLDQNWGSVVSKPHGTLVVWDQVDRIRPEGGSIDSTLNRIFRTLPLHLGMIFHRFLADGRLAISLDSADAKSDNQGVAYRVHPLNPFGYNRSGHPAYPKSLPIVTGGVSMTIRCHIWPPKSSQPEYKLGGKAAQRQGFYFYRNDRLIQAGGWNGWRDDDSEPHLSLARVDADLPTALDAVFGLSIQKSSVDVGPGFKRLLDSARQGEWTLKNYVRDADATYRNAQPSPGAPLQNVPGAGISPLLRRLAAKHLGNGNRPLRRVAIAWRQMPPTQVFMIDREPPRLLLNRRYRAAMAAVGEDGAVVKLLAFLVLRDEFDRERVRAARAEWLEALNDLLLVALLGRVK